MHLKSSAAPRNSHSLTHQPNERYIAFDNKYTSEVSEVLTNPSNYMRYVLINFVNNDISLYTHINSIKRDVKEDNGEVMVSHNYYIEYRLVKDFDFKDQIVPILKNIVMMIDEINSNEIFKGIHPFKYSTQKINFISTPNLSKQYPTLSLQDALNRYVANNCLTYVNEVYQQLSNGKHLLIKWDIVC